jgi:predicted N-acetyltransferase YhbS
MTLQPSAPPQTLVIQPERPQDGAAVDALVNRAFGPGRFTKVSERVREFADFAPELSFVAIEGGRLIGTVRMWRVHVGDQPIAFLGPIAVEEGERRHGLGARLVETACEATDAAGEAAIVLVGDTPYFGRMGFDVAREVVMPAPVDPKRVLSRSVRDVPLKGMVRARR